MKGQTKITNYVPRTTTVVPPLYYDCFGFIIYFTKKTRKILELLTDLYVFELGKEEKDRGFVHDLSSVWDFEVVQLFSTFYPFLFVSRREAVYYATKIGP